MTGGILMSIPYLACEYKVPYFQGPFSIDTNWQSDFKM